MYPCAMIADRVTRGWVIVMTSVLGIAVSFGSLVIFTFGVFLKPLSGQFGWSRDGSLPGVHSDSADGCRVLPVYWPNGGSPRRAQGSVAVRDGLRHRFLCLSLSGRCPAFTPSIYCWAWSATEPRNFVTRE